MRTLVGVGRAWALDGCSSSNNVGVRVRVLLYYMSAAHLECLATCLVLHLLNEPCLFKPNQRQALLAAT